MTEIGFFQLVFYLLILLALVKPAGWYMAKVYEGNAPGLNGVGRPIERSLYWLCNIQPNQSMNWKTYLAAMLVFNALGLLVVYMIQLLQAYLPLNPLNVSAPLPDLAFNLAASFTTNTDWQSYSTENTLSYLTKMLALTTQNFLSAATGMALLMALIRGIAGRESDGLGNFWVDMTRGVLYILLPLSFIFALILVSQGVIQNLLPNQTVNLLQPTAYRTQQVIPMGPVASQVAIKQLGTNGGGFFNANAAHPFENPTPITNFLELLAILLIPAALCYTYGMMVRDKRQGWALLITMVIIFIPFLTVAVISEQGGNPALTPVGIDQQVINNSSSGGNMEGKETRFGIVSSVLWTTATTAASNGSVNSTLDSYMPISSLVPLWLMHLGEVIFGGVGSGLYGMLMLVIIAVFVTGLMVGRTPEYLGKKIEPFEIKMASLAVLVMPMTILISSAISSVIPAGTNAITHAGMHGFSEMLYAFTSMGSNNGSAFSGLNANTPFYNLLGGMVMLISRYSVAIPALAIAGSLIRKKIIPQNSGTLTTHTPMFIILLGIIILLLGALSFFPALALGPISEQLTLWGHYGH